MVCEVAALTSKLAIGWWLVEQETLGFQFWRQGYWSDHLQYVFVVD